MIAAFQRCLFLQSNNPTVMLTAAANKPAQHTRNISGKQGNILTHADTSEHYAYNTNINNTPTVSINTTPQYQNPNGIPSPHEQHFNGHIDSISGEGEGVRLRCLTEAIESAFRQEGPSPQCLISPTVNMTRLCGMPPSPLTITSSTARRRFFFASMMTPSCRQPINGGVAATWQKQATNERRGRQKATNERRGRQRTRRTRNR